MLVDTLIYREGETEIHILKACYFPPVINICSPFTYELDTSYDVGYETVLFIGLSCLFYSNILLSYPVELFSLLSRPVLPILT